jgi:hypothetical protein
MLSQREILLYIRILITEFFRWSGLKDTKKDGIKYILASSCFLEHSNVVIAYNTFKSNTVKSTLGKEDSKYRPEIPWKQYKCGGCCWLAWDVCHELRTKIPAEMGNIISSPQICFLLSGAVLGEKKIYKEGRGIIFLLSIPTPHLPYRPVLS